MESSIQRWNRINVSRYNWIEDNSWIIYMYIRNDGEHVIISAVFDLTFRVRQSFGDLAGGLGARRSSDDPRGQTTELDPQVGESLRPRGRRFYRRFGSGAAYGLAAAASGRRSSENSADARQTFSRRLREYAYSYIFPPYFEKRDPNQLEKSEERWHGEKWWNAVRDTGSFPIVFAITYWCEFAAIGDQDEKFINGSIITDVTSGGGSDGERGHRAEGSYGSTSGRTAVDRRVAQTFERDLGLTNRFFVAAFVENMLSIFTPRYFLFPDILLISTNGVALVFSRIEKSWHWKCE